MSQVPDSHCARSGFSKRSKGTRASVVRAPSRAPTVIAYAVGTSGDVNPMVALCKGLVERGLRVIFLSNDQFQELAGNAGLEFASVGSREEYEETYGTDGVWRSTSAHGAAVHFHHYHWPSSLRAFSRIERLRLELPSIVVLSSGAFNGATMAAERFSLPLVDVLLTPIQVVAGDTVLEHERSAASRRFGRWRVAVSRFRASRCALASVTVNRLRRGLGLSPVPFWKQRAQRPLCSVALLPEWYISIAGSVPRAVRATGFPLYDPVDHEARRQVEAFVGQHGRPLVFTPGSGVRSVREYFFHALEASRALGSPCVLLSPKWRVANDLLRSDALGCDYVDLEYLLPRARALIHHGGIGTAAQAIRAGIPQVIRPLQFDQFENASRVWRLGLGAFIRAENFNGASCSRLLGKMLARAPAMSTLERYSTLVKSSKAVDDASDIVLRSIGARAIAGH